MSPTRSAASTAIGNASFTDSELPPAVSRASQGKTASRERLAARPYASRSCASGQA